MAHSTKDAREHDAKAELRRLQEAREEKAPWKKWGPYLSERQWGTVREDYSDSGNAWDYFLARPGALARLPLGRGRAGRHEVNLTGERR